MNKRLKNRRRIDVTLGDYQWLRRYSGRNNISMAQAAHEIFRSKTVLPAADRESVLFRKKIIRILVGLAGQIAKTNSLLQTGGLDSDQIGEIYQLLLDLAKALAGERGAGK